MNKNYTDSFKESISGELSIVSLEVTEGLVKAALSNGTIDKIPIVSALGAGKNILNNIRDYYVTINILSFLHNIADIPLSKRVKFIEKISNDTKVS